MIVPFFIPHQGCRHRCLFCNQREITGERGGVPSGAEIVARIASYREGRADAAVEVAFFGGSFTALPRALQDSLLQPLRPLLDRGDVTAIRVSTRPDAIDPATVLFLRDRGVATVELGIQSMNERVLAAAERGHGVVHVEEACAHLHDQGVRVGAQLMPGLPGETPAEALESLDRVLELKPHFLRIYPAVVLAGTGLERLHAAGSYEPLTLHAAVDLTKRMLHRALQCSVPVIRIGLQPTPALLAEGAVVAGPFHPAFRQLVESELCYDMLVRLTAGLDPGSDVTLGCTAARISDVAGQHRQNINRLATLGLRVRAIVADPLLGRDDLTVTGDNFIRKGTIVKDLTYGQEGGARV